jgi:hypothetical protein
MSNLSDKIFAVDDIQSEDVYVDVWDVTVQVRSMTARARARMIGNAQSDSGRFSLEEVLPDLVIECTFDPESGERVFSPGDRDAVMAKSASAVEQIATVAMRLSGMNDEAVDEAGKGLSPTQSDASSSN